MVAGADAPRFGEAKNSWLTGTAAWTFVNLSQALLGIQPEYDGLTCCLIDFQLNNAECFFIDKATERGDAVASLSEVNAVRWENRQVI